MNDHRDLVAGVITATRQSPGTAPTSTASATVTAPAIASGSGSSNDIRNGTNRDNSTTPPVVNNKRNSGIFSFLKWFRSTSKESVASSSRDSPTSSLGSIPFGGSNSSLNSTGTAASFNFISPAAYTPRTGNGDKCIHPGPETDTYKARLKQRDKVREKDKNITLRKKYNLFFNRDKGTKQKDKQNKETVECKPQQTADQNQTSYKDDNCKSLPLMTKTKMSDDDKGHRRTNSDSSKGRKAGAYLHVKGKRKAPPPPKNEPRDIKKDNSLSLRRKKRLAPPPPSVPTAEKVISVLNAEPNLENMAKQNGGIGPHITSNQNIEYADVDQHVDTNVMILQNDSLKLDHGVLKSTKDQTQLKPQPNIHKSPLLGVGVSSGSDIPVSPKPWYKRAQNKKANRESKYEPVIPPFIIDNNNHKNFKVDNKMDDKRKSNIMFLTNISELDREAGEIIKLQSNTKSGQSNVDYELPEMPEFMKIKVQDDLPNETQVLPTKRKSAKDLIAKFNAITSVTKVTVNSAFFNAGDKNYFGKKSKDTKDGKSNSSDRKSKDKSGKSNKSNGFGPYSPGGLMKSETTTCILPIPTKLPTPKLERVENKEKTEKYEKIEKPEKEKTEKKGWNCPKCNLENDYWRIICHVCSTIKPYFDNFASSDHSDSSGTTQDKQNPPKLSSSTSSSSNNSLNFNLPTTTTNNNNNYGIITSTSTNSSKLERTERVNTVNQSELPILMRSKTQISFTSKGQRALGANPSPTHEISAETKREEKEKLKKMLIEMKNSLPKRKSNIVHQNRKSTIDEGPENLSLALADDKMAEIQQNKANSNKILAENDNFDGKDDKLLQVDQKFVQKEIQINKSKEVEKTKELNKTKTKESPYQLLRPKDFEDIYSEKIATSTGNTQHLYANLPGSVSGSVIGQSMQPPTQTQTPKELFFNVPKKLNELKQNLASASGGSGLQYAGNAADTLEINKLLRRLENAIAKGDLNDAAGYAKDLAQLKVNCSVIRQKHQQNNDGNAGNVSGNKTERFVVEMYVEDRLSHRGPFPIEVFNEQTVLELKRQVQQEFEIPVEVQRWILGKELAGNDQITLKDLNVTKGCPIFLYLVAPSASAPKVVNIEVKELNIEVRPNQVTKTEVKPSNLPVPVATGSNFVRSEKSAFAVVPNDVKQQDKVSSKAVGTGTNSPRIVGEQLKVHVMIKPKTNAETQIGEIAKSPPPLKQSKLPVITKNVSSQLNQQTQPQTSAFGTKAITTGLVTAVKTSVIVQTAPVAPSVSKGTELNKTPPKAVQEDFSEYDKTIKPPRVNKEKASQGVQTQQGQSQGQGHWICHMCTLVNNPTLNICSVCATVRLKQETQNSGQNKLHYYELMNLDNSDLVPNSDTFECLVCLTEVQPKDGVTLRECLHQFCKPCLAHTIEFCDEAEVKCPYRDADYSCDIALQDREIKALVTRQKYDQFLAKSVAQAENKMDKTFHCKTPDCTGWCVFEDNVNEFRCPICKKTNCLTCQAIHWGLNCRQYQEHMNNQSETDEDAKQTREWLNEMVEKGEALACPACHVVMMKKWGCDWVRCSMCKTEICWVTRGLRWGPAGKGDTSGGCKCGVNGVKCHAKCNYCH